MDFAVSDLGKKEMAVKCAVLAEQEHREYWFPWSYAGRACGRDGAQVNLTTAVH